MADCPKCGVEVEEASAFCESCGAALKRGVKRRKVRGRRGSLAGKIHGRNIKGARIAIMIVAVLTFLEAATTWYFYSALALQKTPGATFEEHQVVGEYPRVDLMLLPRPGRGGERR
ncbi:MAG: zinc ribbon domain-containing protein, partial [Planctomycetota bacterium]